MGSCFLIRTATVEIPAEDASPPVITTAKFIVYDSGGKIYDLNDVSRVGATGSECSSTKLKPDCSLNKVPPWP